jgi:uncharacterized protein
MNIFARKYDKIVLSHPVLWVVFFSLFLVFFGYHALKFKLDASADSLMLEDDEDLIQYNDVINRYQMKDYLFITFDPADELFSGTSLDRLRNLRDYLAELKGVDSLLSIFDVPLITEPAESLAAIDINALKMLGDPDVDVKTAKGAILDSHIYKNLLLSADGKTTAIMIYLESDTSYWDIYNRRTRLLNKKREGPLTPEERELLRKTLDMYEPSYESYIKERHQFIRTVRSVIAPYREHAQIHIVGMPVIADDMMTFIKKDLVVFGIGVCIFIIATLTYIFRRKRWVFLLLLNCLCAVLLMTGILGFFSWKVTVISSNFISLMLILTLSMGIHLAVRFRHLSREMQQAGQVEIISVAVRKMVWPCLYTALTTILAFGSLLFSGIKPVIDFGWMMVIGLTITFLTTFLLFPSVLALLKKVPPLGKKKSRSRVTGTLAIAAEKHGVAVVIVSVCLAIVGIYGVINLKVENSFINYFSKNTELYQGMKLFDDQLAGTNPLEVLLRFGGPETEDSTQKSAETLGESDVDETMTDDDLEWEDDDFEYEDDDDDSGDYWFTPFKIDQIKKVHDHLEEMPEVGKVLSVASIIRFAEKLNGGREFDGLELAVLNKRIPQDMRSGWIDPFVSIDHNEARITLLVRDSLKDLRRKEFIGRIKNDLGEVLGFTEQEAKVSGVLILYNNMLQSLFRSQILTLGLVLSGIGIMLLILFKSVKLALIGIIPNLLAVTLVLGLMGLLNIPLDMMTITIAAITMGIAIDNSIHYIYRFREEYHRNGNYTRTLKVCHQSVGKAILNTSITVIFGFSILVLSNFIPTIYFGIFTALAMLVALLAILALLPILILTWRPF